MRTLFLAGVMVLAVSFPALAQVERVIMETAGASEACRPGLETALKSMSSVYEFAVSIEKQMVSVTYYSGEKFDPEKLRWAVDKGEADVLKFHVSGAGEVQQDGEQQFFKAGEDRFLIVSSSKLPVGVPIGMIGVVDDSKKPLEIKPDDYKVLDEKSPSSH